MLSEKEIETEIQKRLSCLIDIRDIHRIDYIMSQFIVEDKLIDYRVSLERGFPVIEYINDRHSIVHKYYHMKQIRREKLNLILRS